jgi:K+-sensing histidine kinase KdpD
MLATSWAQAHVERHFELSTCDNALAFGSLCLNVHAVYNFIMSSNALKFTDEGSITVKVEQESHNMIAISVADTGVGIPAEFRDKLFHTIGLTTTNEEFLGGSGLGLCICK